MSRILNQSDVNEALRDGRTQIVMGVVTLFDGETSHFEIDGEDLLVDVQIVPDGIPAFCRMGACAGGPGRGVWAVPPIGTEVLVAIPNGDFEADPVIVATLSTGQVPAELNETTLVIVGTARIVIKADLVELAAGSLGPLDGIVHGSGIDSFTGATYTALNNASSKVKAKK